MHYGSRAADQKRRQRNEEWERRQISQPKRVDTRTEEEKMEAQRERSREKAQERSRAANAGKINPTKKATTKATSNAATKAVSSGLGGGCVSAVGIVIIIILILFLLIGTISFVENMPGNTRGGISKWLDAVFRPVRILFSGSISSTYAEYRINEIADYIENMGYDLEGYGFLEQVDNNAGMEAIEENERVIYHEFTSDSAGAVGLYILTMNGDTQTGIYGHGEKTKELLGVEVNSDLRYSFAISGEFNDKFTASGKDEEFIYWRNRRSELVSSGKAHTYSENEKGCKLMAMYRPESSVPNSLDSI